MEQKHPSAITLRKDGDKTTIIKIEDEIKRLEKDLNKLVEIIEIDKIDKV